MAKGDDAVRKKKNKSLRKKLNSRDSSSSAVSARVAALIAAKKRRRNGVRRQCQGMCFSLPTPDDPFNDRHGKKDPAANKFNKKEKKEKKATPVKPKLTIDEVSLNNEKTVVGVDGCDGPSKFLITCLNQIENSLIKDGPEEEHKPLFASSWGIEFWKFYSAGKDILDSKGTCSNVEQISWIVSSAADTISRKDEEGLSCSSPFLLFLVPSQDKAMEVRSVCKPLKVHGIHAVSIHPGASLDHQIQGLKNCEPEFLIATPQRLLELISSNAVDISGVSLLVVDGLKAHHKNGYLDSIKAIAESLSGNTRRLIFNDFLSPICVPLLKTLLSGPVHRL